MNLNNTNWKEFKFVDIFEIKKGFYNKKPEHTIRGGIPFLGATESNNGVTEYYSIEDIDAASKTGDEKNVPLSEKLFPPNALCVTNNGSVGFAFYQATEFTCSHDVNPLYIRGGCFNPFTALFVATVIKLDRYRWAYGRKWRPERMVKSVISLPCNKEGNPDWAFMENYIKSINHKPITTTNRVDKLFTLSVDHWKDYKIDNLFEVRKGKRLTANDQTDGTTPYIGAIDSNNGVANYIGQDAIHEGNTISLSYNGSVGEAFYQPEPFWATDDVNVLYFKSENGVLFNKYIALFICAVLRQEKYRYSYGRKWVLDGMKSTVIKLPAKVDEKPDWLFMENYMKSLPYGDRI